MSEEQLMRSESDRLSEAARDYRCAAKVANDARMDLVRDLSRHTLRVSDNDFGPVVSRGAKAAALYWMSSDFALLVDAAAPTFPDQPMLAGDPPSSSGVVVIDGSLAPPAVDNAYGIGSPRFNALTWSPIRNAEGQDGIVTAMAAYDQPHAHWQPTSLSFWFFGDPPAPGESGDFSPGFRAMMAMWTLAKQRRLGSGGAVQTDRHALRRAVRAGLPPSAADVRLLDLRKPERAEHVGSRTVDFSHRWMVSGHWRNQWMPASKTHRAQWIAPHVKGPDDKPLVIREDVRVLR